MRCDCSEGVKRATIGGWRSGFREGQSNRKRLLGITATADWRRTDCRKPSEGKNSKE